MNINPFICFDADTCMGIGNTTYKPPATNAMFFPDSHHLEPCCQKGIKENRYKFFAIKDMAHLDQCYADILFELHYSCDSDTMQLLGSSTPDNVVLQGRKDLELCVKII